MYRSALLVSLVLLALACNSPEPAEHATEFDDEISAAAPIADRAIRGGEQGFPGEDINLTPSSGLAGVVFPSEWDAVQGRRRGYSFARTDGMTMRLSNLVEPDPFLGDVGVDIRGLGSERGSLVNLDDVTSGLDNSGAFFGPGSDGDYRGRPERLFALPETGKSTRRRTWKRSELKPNLSRLLVGTDEELPLDRMGVSVRVAGHRARVVLDLSFTNDHDRQLEGTFQLRLPAGASPFWMAFGEEEWRADPQRRPHEMVPARSVAAIREVLGSSPLPMREARMAPREKAARAYGETVRRRVDPSLLEWAGGGIFAAKVFPLLPGKSHRIVVGYDLDLVVQERGRSLTLDLPTDLPARSVSLSVAGGTPFLVNGTPASGDERRFVLDGTAFPTLAVQVLDADPTLLTDGGHFGISFTPDLPKDPVAGSPHAVFLVDVSLSSNPERFQVFRDLLPAILERNREQIRDFAVLFFNIETFWWRRELVPNTSGNVAKLLSYMDELVLEGATDLGAALRACADAPFVPPTADVFLLSDAAATWGPKLPTVLPHPIFAYRTGIAGTDLRTLSFLARESGGAVFSVNGEKEIETAATAHRNRPFTIESVSVAGGSDVLIAGRPVSVYPGQTLTVAGRGRPESGEALKLVLSRDGAARVVEIPLSTTIETALAKRVYGEIAVQQLEGIGETGHEAAVAYAREFRVVGTSSSLVMLESEEDYEAFEIDEWQRADLIVSSALAAAREPKTPKAEFLAWLARIKDLPGVNIALPESVSDFIRQLPADAFEIAMTPVTCRVRMQNAVGRNYLEDLATRALTAEKLTAEADRRREQFGSPDALKVLSSLVEESPASGAVLRDVAHSAMADGLFAPALYLLRRVAHARPYEPETYRALARCYEAVGNPQLAIVYYELALAGKWPARSGDFKRILALDYLRLLRGIQDRPVDSSVKLLADRRLTHLLEEYHHGTPGLVVVLTWNTDRSDMDLYITDPAGEECSYQHKETKIGGQLTADVTAGFGPEMFTLAKPVPGTYTIAVQNFSGDQNRMSLRTRAFVTIYEHWGMPNEKVTRRAVTLEGVKEMAQIAAIEVQ